MTAGIPLEKSVELLETYGDMLYRGVSINDMDYMRSARELEKYHTANSISALGILHAIAGRVSKANQLFESSVFSIDETDSIAINYCFVLQETGQFVLLRSKVYEYADRYNNKKLTAMAYSNAYRFGDRNSLEKYMDMHIKLLSEEEGRGMAEQHKLELLSEVDDAYRSSGCTNEQFALIAALTMNVSKDFSATLGRCEVSRNNNNCYVVDVTNKEPKTIASMNYELAERICSEEILDNCELIARFSPVRELHKGVSYGYRG